MSADVNPEPGAGPATVELLNLMVPVTSTSDGAAEKRSPYRDSRRLQKTYCPPVNVSVPLPRTLMLP
jgi:hypothetical protein